MGLCRSRLPTMLHVIGDHAYPQRMLKLNNTAEFARDDRVMTSERSLRRWRPRHTLRSHGVALLPEPPPPGGPSTLSFPCVPSRHVMTVETTAGLPTKELWHTCVKPRRWERCACRPRCDCGWKEALRTGTIGCFPPDVWMAFARSRACFGIFCSVYPRWSVVCGTASRRPSHSRRPRVARHHAQP